MKYPAYPKYKDSGVEWLGEVPEHWEVYALKRLARLKSGEMITVDAMEDDGSYPVFGGNGFRGYTTKFTHDGCYPLIGRQGALCGNINYSIGQFWASEHAIVVLQTKPVITKWLGELLRSMNLNQYSVSAAQPGLSVDSIANLTIPVPPLPEQRTIAAFLDVQTSKLDTLIAKKRELIDKLKEKRAALITRTVTRGLPPDAAKAAGLDPQPKMKDSGVEWLGEVPEHWEVKRLQQHCLTITDGAHISPDISSAEFHFVSTVDIKDGRIDFENCLKTSADNYGYLVKTGCKPMRGDVLFSKDGTVGRTAVISFDIDFVVASSLVILTPDVNSLYFLFLDLWLNNSLLQQEVGLLMSGAALRRISVEKVARLPLTVPPLPEQRAIATYLDRETASIDALVGKVETAIDRLQEYRAALITAAVTGRIDVRGAVQ